MTLRYLVYLTHHPTFIPRLRFKSLVFQKILSCKIAYKPSKGCKGKSIITPFDNFGKFVSGYLNDIENKYPDQGRNLSKKSSRDVE